MFVKTIRILTKQYVELDVIPPRWNRLLRKAA